MNKLYSSPLRVYLLLGALALFGIYSGLTIPISLYPNSLKPTVWVNISNGGLSSEEFQNNYGKSLEEQLRNISAEKAEVEKVEAYYNPGRARYTISFKWGGVPDDAEQEVKNVVNSYAARFPTEIRDSVRIWINNENSGFFAATFYSDQRSLDEVYEMLEPILMPRLTGIKNALEAELWNPSRKEIKLTLQPDVMAALRLFPNDIEEAVKKSLTGLRGGSFSVGPKQISIEMPRQAFSIEDIGKIVIPTNGQKIVHLSDIANIYYGPRSNFNQIVKTSGTSSLILFASPKPGGNVKKMAEDMIREIEAVMPSLPLDIQYKTLVDPSEFIRSAINNVSHEVAIGAFLAVCILFLFIGSLRNVVTAAIEIPLSIVLAFILMKFFNININLISLGGLALSAGMNVDGSVVVMENIFRHFDQYYEKTNHQPHQHMTAAERLKIVVGAVAEVRFAVIASTISSLVVFIPLAFTSELSYAILGDLAKAVVFSHGFSAIIALILVPTVRLQLLSFEAKKHGALKHSSPIERYLNGLERAYGHALRFFISSPKIKWGTCLGVVMTLSILAWLILPKLPREIIGLPDTDWIVFALSTDGNTMIKQMDMQTSEVERELLTEFGSKVQYTFTQIGHPNYGHIMLRLKNRKDMTEIWKALEAKYTSTATMEYEVEPWNPSELPIPNPPHLEATVNGGTMEQRMFAAQEVTELFEKHKLMQSIWSNPKVKKESAAFLEPNPEQWSLLQNSGERFSYSDLTDLIRVATNGRTIAEMPIKDRMIAINLQFPENLIGSVEDIAALPVGVGSKIVPLKSLFDVSLQKIIPSYYRENGRDRFVISGKHKLGDEGKAEESLKKAKELVDKWMKEKQASQKNFLQTVVFEDPQKDLTLAIRQLSFAVGLSILLIFMTLVFQFGSIIESILVLVAVPLGFIGVLLSLYIFGSKLSLNSILGVILLNGIAVANSILLVDFMKRRIDAGLAPVDAAVDAARKRLRPILITSLTTVLGMLPIALGFGEGGKILQPLGIAVSGGLWFSMILTLFIVPALQVSYFNRKLKVQ